MPSTAAQKLKHTFRSGRAILLAGAACEAALAATIALLVVAAGSALAMAHASFTQSLRDAVQALALPAAEAWQPADPRFPG